MRYIPRDAGVWCPKVAQLLDVLDMQCQTLARLAFSRERFRWVVATPECTEAKVGTGAPKRPLAAREQASKQVRILKSEGNISRAGAKEMIQVEAEYDTQEEQQQQRRQRKQTETGTAHDG